MDLVPCNFDAGGLVDFDTLAVEVGFGLSNASLGPRPLAVANCC